MSTVTLKGLLEAGVHFGHPRKKWCPKMSKYIFQERMGIHIVDLSKTTKCLEIAYNAARQVAQSKKTVLFVGTKKQAQQIIEKEAKRCGMPYVSNRWLGGMLTNFSTIRSSVRRLKSLERMEVDGTFDNLTKKEVANLQKEKNKLEKNLGGIKDMTELPGAIFVVDTRNEAIAIKEAKTLGIPVIAIVDTNCDPTDVDFPIPGNDDAIRSISLLIEVISNAVLEADTDAFLEIIDTLPDEKIEEGPQDKNLEEKKEI